MRQHAENPVDRREWDAQASAEAATRDLLGGRQRGRTAFEWSGRVFVAVRRGRTSPT
ncbi:hypothetical protein C6575_31265 [Nocardia seriolae]|nr:hypothetical protein C6575_31265 [Nocardia seriolae]QOW37764.1 hypothetical protein IMZ23_37845 [Nocardia seriolae]QUN21482.1 hypothetical protein KEC46_16980 [Nocardia seriolae]